MCWMLSLQNKYLRRMLQRTLPPRQANPGHIPQCYIFIIAILLEALFHVRV